MEPGSKQDGAVNMTRAMEALSPWLNHPRKTIIRVEVLVVAAAALLLLQFILGSCKRRWHSSVLKYGLEACNGVMFPLTVYILGTMQSSPVKNSSYPVLAVFLLIASGGTTAINQYDFYDRFDKKILQVAVHFGQDLFYYLMFALLMNPNGWKVSLNPKDFKFYRTSSSACVIVLGIAVVLTKFHESLSLVSGYKMKTKSIFIKNKRRMQVQESGNDRPCCESGLEMDGCTCNTITIEKIWYRCGDSADGKAWKDLCLSYALFRQLLDRRYFGRPDTCSLLAHGLMFEKLLPSEDDFNRAFRIIEVELGFFYDFFFTKYFTFHWMDQLPADPLGTSLPLTVRILSMSKPVLIVVVGVFVFRRSLILETPSPIIEVHISESDRVITLLVLCVALIVELLQCTFYLASDRIQVFLACRYVNQNGHTVCDGLTARVAGLLRRVIPAGALRNEIDQHSVILGREHSVQVSDAVRKAIAKFLIVISSDANLRNGVARKKEMFDKYHWASKNQSELELILIWHIATEYCVVSDNLRTAGINTRGNHHGVAVNLSRYCAYLIGSVPELLAYHESDTRLLTEKVMEEREELLGSCKRSEIYNKMKNLQGIEEEDNHTKLFQKGVRLGKQLESSMDPWEVLQYFWVETIVHAVAFSTTTTEQHMQHLENGGEFITHVWALLAHSGIQMKLSRNKEQETQDNPGSGSSASE